MGDIYLPDYKGGSIVNLMSSIAHAFKAKHPYPELRALPSSEIKASKKVILLVIDGLGYEYLQGNKNSFMKKNCRDKMTSVFLPTTACGVSTFVTGVPPQQHGLTGWFMNIKEIGIVSTVLLFRPRIGGSLFSEKGIGMSDIICEKPFFSKIKADSEIIYRKDVLESDFTNATTIGAKKIGYKNMKDFFKKIAKSASSSKKKYVFAYWMDFDTANHDCGIDSKESAKHFKQLDAGIKKLYEKIKGTDTLLIITADHGAINTPASKIFALEDHPKLGECLSLPLCGEGRVAYCYVHPAKAHEFESYVRDKFGKYCIMYKAEEIIKKNFYGLGKPNKKLFDRVGDYVLIMKNGYSLNDTLCNKKSCNVANHGGVSKEEMFVPLIVLKA